MQVLRQNSKGKGGDLASLKPSTVTISPLICLLCQHGPSQTHPYQISKRHLNTITAVLQGRSMVINRGTLSSNLFIGYEDPRDDETNV